MKRIFTNVFKPRKSYVVNMMGIDNPAIEMKNGNVCDEIFVNGVKGHSSQTCTIHVKNTIPTAIDEKNGTELSNEPKGKIERIQSFISNFFAHHQIRIRRIILIALLIIFVIFLGFAIAHNFQKVLPLLIMTIIVCIGLLYYKVAKVYLAKPFEQYVVDPMTEKIEMIWENRFVRWGFYGAIIVAIVAYLIVDTKNDRYRLISVVGLAFYVIVCFLFSTNPAKVKWRPVVWGIALQFIIGFLVLRWPVGLRSIEWLSNQIVKFLDYTQKGTAFVFGFLVSPPNICGMFPIFVFTVLQVIIFFGSVVAVLYYYGIMQFVLYRMAWIMQVTMGTTAAESLNAAACVFLGMTEAPLLIKPYLSRMTKSELHTMLTSGYACIAGSLFAAYVSFGACPVYLLSGVVMSAPASLAVSKLLLPETEESQLKRVEDLHLPPTQERNIFEAISVGASSVVEIISHIVANLIVFIALLAFIDNVIAWLADMIGWQLTFQSLMGYLFFPLALVMGSSNNPDWSGNFNETLVVAQLMGTKTVLNEFIAYQNMGQFALAKQISGRSQMMATYALHGFSNLAGIGIQLGFLGSICPEKRYIIAEVVVRALIGGSITCWMTACVAGILVEEPFVCLPLTGGANCTVIP